MKQKQIALDSLHHDKEWVELRHPDKTAKFNYGKLKNLARFQQTHPKVMKNRIAQMDWTVKEEPATTTKYNQERLRIRILSFIENRVLKTRIGEQRNYILLKHL